MKKLINDPEDVTREQLEGLALAHPDLLEVHFDPTFVKARQAPEAGKVAILSGGGSGHEPMHAGYVGRGMLDAACPGQVFTSPTPDQMLEAGKAVAGGRGILQIVKNYTGDVMNFQMAADLLREEGIAVRNIVIDDDVAVKDSTYTAGRRGTGTTVIAEKICGAAAVAGYDLDRLAQLCRRVNLRGKSMGMALTSCIVPQNGRPTFEIGEDEIEIGIGIHGEPGVERIGIETADAITEILAGHILDDGPYARTLTEWDPDRDDWVEVEVVDETLVKGDRLIALVNGMGGTPLSELYTVYARLHALVEASGMSIVRRLIGPYMTSLEMQGISITLVKADDELLRLFDAPVHTAGLRWGC
ncbi:dihydroxyacetone kinase subunit DhaK [Imhoffiella purpurea]|uniref:Phosphoenolpyruvate-dihydroxyacetone phosphotransferase, dihydroxyacetone binding subunit DhaK n=1 Tax=Imhoffiella purpurea TaxID=1249627 RepID=W9VVK9_9GAMM|nr:dihydroxyacetone kinase subunit DhaK [Imhoffiella purpurea]EXJ14450.1 Phosphoenolpyruvate-dihydroxyacetone phosphotransferase, dihydroxyacetone binding subunit DhaK [Imhoffiella purpurea]